jgi:hypothetical protein
MCVPDLKGTQGTFTLFTSEKKELGYTGGCQVLVEVNSNKVQGFLRGPKNIWRKDKEEMKIPFTCFIDKKEKTVLLKIGGQNINLQVGQYSDWINLTFKSGVGMKVHGICRVLVTEIEPHFKMYVSPINISPDKPGLPISHPFYYSIYLAKMQGNYATLGLAEDTWALNERVINEDAFLKQCYLNHEEREKMFFNALKHTNRGLCVCVFDITDRVQHMFFRYLDANHPSNRDKETEKYKNTIEDLYINMDRMIGRVMKFIDQESILFVISDHGFKQFKWGVNLNSWLYKNGYLKLKEGKTVSNEWFAEVDWDKTKAFAFGLAGIFINTRGREKKGIVKPGQEKDGLKKELISKLNNLMDDRYNQVAIRRIYDASEVFKGPYTMEAPDLIVGYAEGYRASWDSAIGKVTNKIFEDNTKSWSGDHAVDPEIVPGVLFCSQRIEDNSPSLIDIAPTILKLFGVAAPEYMDGRYLNILT